MATVHYEAAGARSAPRSAISRLWDRELDSYPNNGVRYSSLAIVVLATVILYYELYISGAVATQIISSLGMSFLFYVNISVVGNALGAFASLFAGAADRYGRANLVVVGLFVTGGLTLFGIPNANSKWSFAIIFAAISFVEGVILVATPALVRDFSPQVGRASAMGFWTLGPVLGSLVVSVVSSNTLTASDTGLSAVHHQFVICGVVGVILALVALVALRELSPALRDQLMVSMRDRVLVEARARGISAAEVEAATKNPWRQMLRPNIVGSAFAISVFLLIYYTAVGFYPIFFETIFGFSAKDANGLGNWFWAFDALTLVVVGFLSDKLRVRKPFMVLGALGSIAFTTAFLTRATHPHTGYYAFVGLLIGIGCFQAMAYAPWMASYTETVEARNPALTATGLAVWGWIIRVVIALSLIILPHVVSSATTLVTDGPRTQALATKYAAELATFAKIDKPTLAALGANPNNQAAQVQALADLSGKSVADVVKVITLSAKDADQLATVAAVDPATLGALALNPGDQAAAATAVGEIMKGLGVSQSVAVGKLTALGAVQSDLVFLQANGPAVRQAGAELKATASVPKADLEFLQTKGAKVQAAAISTPHQWQHWFWVCVGGQVLFLPLVLLMAGRWDPRKAKRDAEAHEAAVAAELAALAD